MFPDMYLYCSHLQNICQDTIYKGNQIAIVINATGSPVALPSAYFNSIIRKNLSTYCWSKSQFLYPSAEAFLEIPSATNF